MTIEKKMEEYVDIVLSISPQLYQLLILHNEIRTFAMLEGKTIWSERARIDYMEGNSRSSGAKIVIDNEFDNKQKVGYIGVPIILQKDTK